MPIIGYNIHGVLYASDIRRHVPTKRVCKITPRKNASETLTCDILSLGMGPRRCDI